MGSGSMWRTMVNNQRPFPIHLPVCFYPRHRSQSVFSVSWPCPAVLRHWITHCGLSFVPIAFSLTWSLHWCWSFSAPQHLFIWNKIYGYIWTVCAFLSLASSLSPLHNHPNQTSRQQETVCVFLCVTGQQETEHWVHGNTVNVCVK